MTKFILGASCVFFALMLFSAIFGPLVRRVSRLEDRVDELDAILRGDLSELWLRVKRIEKTEKENEDRFFSANIAVARLEKRLTQNEEKDDYGT